VKLDAEAITASLEVASERAGDLTSRVYARLFAAHPEMEAQFVRYTNGLVKGEMLARVFEMVLDFIDRGAYAAHMVQCEVVTHEGYGVPPDVFPLFFDTVVDTLRDAAGPDWTAAMETAWAEALSQLHWFATHPDQSAAVPSAVFG
jgi:hemoglobin-like flavoprotein